MTSSKISMPAVVCKGGFLTMTNCEIKGHSLIPTIGLYSLYADLFLKNCRIYRHRGGGVILHTRSKNKVHLYDCEIAYNVNFGIICEHEDGRPMIEK